MDMARETRRFIGVYRRSSKILCIFMFVAGLEHHTCEDSHYKVCTTRSMHSHT